MEHYKYRIGKKWLYINNTSGKFELVETKKEATQLLNPYLKELLEKLFNQPTEKIILK